MKRTMQYSVGGQTFDVPADEVDQFGEAARMRGLEPVSVRRFRVNGQQLDVPDAEVQEFSAAAKQCGIVPEEVRTVQMADGSSRSFTPREMSQYLRSPEYRNSSDYVAPEQGSPTWAGIKGAITGAAEGAYEGGKAGLAKAAWALPQVGTGIVRAVGNVANLGGNTKNGFGNALVNGANAADSWMEEAMPTSTAERLGYEDWGTKTGDFFGNVAGMAVKFAPASVPGIGPMYAEAMFASDGINAYSQTFDTAKSNGMDDVSANALGMSSGLVNYFGGKALMKAGGIGNNIANPLLRELAKAGVSGAVMGAQGGANQAIGNISTGRPVAEGVPGAVAEGVAEGAAFHGANMIPRIPMLVRQTKAHFDAAKDWILDAAQNDPAMLSDLMDQPALGEVIKARREGSDVSRKMGESIFLPNNMSGEQRNAVVDAIIEYRDSARTANVAKKTAAGMVTRDAQAERTTARKEDVSAAIKADDKARSMRGMEERSKRKAEMDEYERQESERKAREAEAEARPTDAELAEIERNLPRKEPVEPEMWDDYKEWLVKTGKNNNAKNWNRWVMEREMDPALKIPTADQMRYNRFAEEMEARRAGMGAEERTRAPYDYEIPPEASVAEERRGAKMLENRDTEFKALKDAGLSDEDAGVYLTYGKEEFYRRRVAEWEARRKAALRKEKPFDEPKPEMEDYDALLAKQKEQMDAADAAAKEEAHKRRQDDLESAFKEYDANLAAAEKARKSGKRGETQTPEVIRDAVKDDAVLKRIDAAYRKAKTQEERNALMEQFKARVAELQGAKESGGGVKNGGEPAKTDANTQKLTGELSKTDGVEVKGSTDRKPSNLLDGTGDFSKKAFEVTDAIEMDRPGPEKAKLRKSTYDALVEQAKKESTEDLLHTFNMTVGGQPPTGNKGWIDYFGAPTAHICSIITRELESRGFKYNKKTGYLEKQSPSPSAPKPDGKGRMVKAETPVAQEAPATHPAASETNTAEPTAPTAAKSARPAKSVADGKGGMEAEVPVETQYARSVKAVESAEKESANARSFDELADINSRARSAIGKITREQENELMERLDKAWKDNKGRVENVRSQGGYTPSKEIIEAKSRIEAMPTFTSREKAAKKKAQKDWLLSSVDDAIKSHGDTRTLNGKSYAESFADEFELLLRRLNTTYERAKLYKLNEQIDTAKKTMEQGEMLTFDVPDDGTFRIRNNPEALALFKHMVQKRLSPKNLKEGTLAKAENPLAEDVKSAGIGEKKLADTATADRIETLRSDPAVVAWVREGKRGEVVDGKVSPRNVADYLRDQVAKAVDATKRVFTDAKVEVKDREYEPLLDENDGGGNVMRLRNGDAVVGTFDPATKTVTLYRGADAKTVYHELIGHGVEDWARRNNDTIHNALMEVARTAPREIVNDVRARYQGADEATIAKEIIARIAEGKGMENIKLREAPKAWYAKAYVAVRDALLGFMQKLGLRNIDLSKIDDMTPTEAIDYIMREIGKGKTLGKLNAADDGKVGLAEKWANAFWKRHASLEKISKEAADAKALQPGREAAFQVLNYNRKVEKLTKMLRDGDISMESVDEYMKSVAAPERNHADRAAHVQRLLSEGLPRAMAERQADLLIRKLNGGTSGMSDELAEATRRHYEASPKFDAIKKVADELWKIQDEGMTERVRAGLVSETDYAAWKDREPHHVPFRSSVDENGEWVNGWARGMDAPEFLQHKGRFSESGSPSAWIMEEFANAHLRAIENDTRRVLAQSVANNPSIGTIETNPALKEMRVKGDGGSPNVVTYKTINEHGESVVHRIVLNGERGAAAAASYTNANLKRVGRKTQAFMRAWAATATELSPTFALRNLAADNLAYAKTVLLERGAAEGARFLKDYVKNHADVAKEVWKFARDGEVDDRSTLARYIKAGSMIGGFQREGYIDIREKFDASNVAKSFAAGRDKGGAIRRWTLDIVKAVNGYSELINRVAAFKTQIEHGMSDKAAALASRRDFVDFNQKGNITPITNTLFMFSNSAIGATMRQLQAVDKGLRTPEGRRALVGLAVFGMTEAVIEHFWNAQEDAENETTGEATGKDVPEHTRKVSIYFRSGGRVFRLPVHEDPLMRLIYAANAVTRCALGDIDRKTLAKELGGDVIGDIPVMFGMGSKELSAGFNTWAPSMLQPLVQGLENKDYAGRPIYRPKYDEAIPDSQNGRNSTASAYKWTAEMINSVTGGNAGRSGSVDITPETAKLINESVFKNLGKDLANAADTGLRILTGDFGGMDSRRMPVVRDVIRKSEGNDNRYFEAVRRFEEDAHEWKRMRSEWTPDERRSFVEEHPWIRGPKGETPIAKRIQTQVNILRRMESGQRRMNDGTWRPHEYTEEQMQRIKGRRKALQSKLIGSMHER